MLVLCPFIWINHFVYILIDPFISQTMAWILDEYSKFHGHSPAVVTGKPIVSIIYKYSPETLKPHFSCVS